MSKSALGRGLGELMSGQKVPSNLPTAATTPVQPVPAGTEGTETPVVEVSTTATEADVQTQTQTVTAAPTPGVGTLLRGKVETPKPTETPKPAETQTQNPFAATEPKEKPPINWSVLKWILIIADLLLIVPTSYFVMTKSAKLSFMEGTVCVVTFAFAGCLGTVAYFIHRHENK